MERQKRTGGRRAVRPAGTVGGDEAWLRSTLPAPQPSASPATHPAGSSDPAGAAPDGGASRAGAVPHEPAVPRRSLDDSDLGWGDRADDSNDDRLQRNRPPHW